MVEKLGARDFIFKQILVKHILKKVKIKEKMLIIGKAIMLIIMFYTLGFVDG